MKKLLYSVLIALGISACVENDVESPSTTSSPENLVNGRQAEQDPLNSTAKRTPITQEEFNQIVANTPEGQPVVIERRKGFGLTIGSEFAPSPHPELLTFHFIDCRFDEGVRVVNTFQAIVTFDKCVMNRVALEVGATVQVMEITRSRIEELKTMESSRVSGLTITGGKIQTIINDLGGSTGFQVIGFQ